MSGTVAGAFGGLVSVVPETWRTWALIPVAAVLLAFELAGRPLGLIQNRRLVPQEIIPRSRFEGPFQFGFEMGTGVRTFTPTALPHALVLTLVLVGGLLPGLLAGLGFGLGRVLMPLTRSLSGDPARWDRHLLGRLAWVGRWCAAGFLLALLVLLMGW
ncbi:hypothetical protein [Herbidospora cretacea]|uniref:hypothetical protein n=1 Tax=Herbidospora cretacea TaxID=28444 RepID=UPI0007741984|nr:hypothetical protein [Herbidospora cretacea]